MLGARGGGVVAGGGRGFARTLAVGLVPGLVLAAVVADAARVARRLGTSGPLRHSGVVCVLQCAQRLPGMPGSRDAPAGSASWPTWGEGGGDGEGEGGDGERVRRRARLRIRKAPARVFVFPRPAGKRVDSSFVRKSSVAARKHSCRDAATRASRRTRRARGAATARTPRSRVEGPARDPGVRSRGFGTHHRHACSSERRRPSTSRRSRLCHAVRSWRSTRGGAGRSRGERSSGRNGATRWRPETGRFAAGRARRNDATARMVGGRSRLAAGAVARPLGGSGEARARTSRARLFTNVRDVLFCARPTLRRGGG